MIISLYTVPYLLHILSTTTRTDTSVGIDFVRIRLLYMRRIDKNRFEKR